MHIILVDMRESNGQIVPIMEDMECTVVAQFESDAAAVAAMQGHPLDAFPWAVVDPDEDLEWR